MNLMSNLVINEGALDSGEGSGVFFVGCLKYSKHWERSHATGFIVQGETYHYRRREGSVMVRLEVECTIIEGGRVCNGTIRGETYHYRRRESL
jgi:hypothetical protein